MAQASTTINLEAARAEASPSDHPSPPDHPFLTGIHRPMNAELTLDELPVEGELPASLSGRYVRIGPNPVDPHPARYHWFSGDGMIHGLAVRDGRALWYRNRWVRSSAVAAALGDDPAPGPRHARSEVVNTNVIGLADGTWALVEAGSYPVRFSADLEEQAYDAFGDTLHGSYAAHPHRDPATDCLHAITYEAGVLDQVRHVVVDAAGTVVREEQIPVRDGPSIHDCAVTANYVAVLDLPVTFSRDAAQRGLGFPFRWNTAHPARVGLLPKGGSGEDVVWNDIDPCYVFHVGNAWEDASGKVALDVVVYETMFDGEIGGPAGTCLGVERWIVDPRGGRVERRTISSLPQEFPRYDERRTGRPTRYLYTVAAPDHPTVPGSRLYKHDTDSGRCEMHDFGSGRVPGEFVFVPESDDGEEDDGWMIGLVVDVPAEMTDLVVLDARRFGDEAVAKVRLPHRIPPGFHGNWIGD